MTDKKETGMTDDNNETMDATEAFQAGWDDAARFPGQPPKVADPTTLSDALRRSYEAGFKEWTGYHNAR